MFVRLSLYSLIAVFTLLPFPAWGGTLTWTGSADNDWNNPANWNVTSAPDNGADGIPSGGDQALLPAALATTINVSASTDPGQIYQLAGAASGYTFTGQPLTASAIRVDNAATLTMNNNLSSTGNLTFQPQNASANIEIQGIITSIGGSLSLTGIGRIDLFQANTFTAGVSPNGSGLTVIHNPLSLGNGGLMQAISNSSHTLGLVSDLDWDGGLRLAHAGDPGTINVRIQSGTGDRTFTVTGGTSNNPGTIALGPNEAGSSGNLILNFERTTAGTTTIRNPITTVDNSIVELSAVTGATFNLTAGTSTFVSEATTTISGSGKVVKSGDGSALIAVDQTYTGGTDLDGGMIQLTSPNGSLPDSGVIQLAAGTTLDFNGVNDTVGTLAGIGTVDLGGAAVTANEGLQPGVSPGTLTIEGAGSLALSGLSTFELGPLSGPNDLVQFTGSADLQLGGTLQVMNLGGLELGQYTLFELSGGSISGSFDQVLVPGFTGTILQSGGNVLLNVSPIPEPSTALLTSCAFLALFGYRRKLAACNRVCLQLPSEQK